jgi:hypothetical protein
MMFELGYLSVCESDYLDDLSTVFDSSQCCDVNCGIWQVRADAQCPYPTFRYDCIIGDAGGLRIQGYGRSVGPEP